MSTKYIRAFYLVFTASTVLIISLLGGYGIRMTQKASRLEREYNALLHERNLIDQNYSRMRREFEDKEEIYRAQEEKLKMLEEAETIDDYIRLWKGES